MKKLISLIGAGALLLSVAGSAFAVPMIGSDNYATVGNTATAYANTGGNTQNGTAKANMTIGSSAVAGSGGNRTINTGDAYARAGALTVANTHVDLSCIGCTQPHDDDVAVVGNGALADANTGLNAQDDSAKVKLSVGSGVNAGSTGNRTVNTGNTTSKARAWTVVNTHVGL